MTVDAIAKKLGISITEALNVAKNLVEVGGFIDMSETEYEAMHPRFTSVNMYRRMCERENIKFQRNVTVDNIGITLEKFYEEKQLGIETLTEIVGMPKIEPDEKWAVSVCKLQKGKDKWRLVKLKENSEVKHECLEEKVIALKIKDFKIEDNNHWSFLVEDHLNRAVEI